MDFSLGFCMKGFIIVLLPMLPNILYFIKPQLFIQDKESNHNKVLDIIEHGGQFIFLGMLIMIIPSSETVLKGILCLAIIIFLIGYYVLWLLLFLGNKNIVILMCMAIFPVIYFIISEIWIANYLAIIPTVIFGIVHTFITYKDFTNK